MSYLLKNQLLLKSVWQTLRGTGWYLLIVFVVVAAYVAIKGIEQSKNNFQSEQKASFALMDEVKSAPKDIVGVDTNKIRGLIPIPRPAPIPTPQDPLKAAETAEQKTDGAQASPPHLIDKYKGIPFQNVDDFIARLNEDIVADKEEAIKVEQDRLNVLLKTYNAENSRILISVASTSSQLEDKAVSPETVGSIITKTMSGEEVDYDKLNIPNDKYEGQRKALVKQLNVNATQSKNISRMYNTAVENFRQRVKAINDESLQKISIVYDSRPNLKKEVDDAKKAKFKRDFVSASILNEGSGSYAVYQVFWYFFMVVMVFGLLYFIFLLLRPLPPFATGTELLSEQATSFFKPGGRVTPELAKAAAVTVAALGIGTAVAVAGSTSSSRRARNAAVDDDYVVAEAQQRDPNLGSRLSGTGRQTTGSQPNVEVTTPIVTPSPTTVGYPYPVYVPSSSDMTRINTLDDRLERLSGTVERQGIELGVKADKTMAEGTATDLAAFRRDILPGLVDTKNRVYTEFDTPAGKIPQLELAKNNLQNEFFRKLDAASDTMGAIRSDNLDPLRKTTQRNVFQRVGRFLGFGKSYYMVSEQSYRALENLICIPCTNPDRSVCPSPCMNAYGDSALVNRLQMLKGRPPMEEKAFIEEINRGAGRDLLGTWKSVVLKYTRVSY